MAVEQDSSFRDQLPQEVQGWQDEGIVRPEQARMILARYGLLAGETQQTVHQSQLTLILGVLGAILVGVGVILVIGAHWDAIPPVGRLILLMAATAACYYFGYGMAYQSRNYPKVGMALLLLGSILWGASIFLIGQSYNAGGEGGEIAAVFYWFIGVLPLAYVLISPLHLGMSLILFSVWYLMAISINHPVANLVLGVTCALGVGFYAIGRLHSRWRTGKVLELPYLVLGVLGMFAGLYAFSFRGFWEAGWYGVTPPDYGLAVPALAGAAVVALALLAIEASRQNATPATVAETAGLIVLLAICAAAVFNGRISPSSETGTLLMVVFNLILLAWEVGLVAVGWHRNMPQLANAAVIFFAIQVITRYFDLFGTMLNSGLLFIGAGILLFGGGVMLERYRRRLVAQIEGRVAL